MLNYVEIVYPEAKFNSALVQKYSSGEMFIPMHSDSEPEIADGSSILTISLGDSRQFNIQEKDSSYKSSVLLQHGDSIIMTKSSQEFFSHGIPPEEGKGLRISVTLRLLDAPEAIRQAEIPCSIPQSLHNPTSVSAVSTPPQKTVSTPPQSKHRVEYLKKHKIDQASLKAPT